MLFFYVRHGDPIYDPDSLTEQGKEQARALAGRLSREGLDRVYVSSSNRARMTAAPTCARLGIEPTVLDWCHEDLAWREFTVTIGSGPRRWAFQNRTTVEMMAKPDVRALGREFYRHAAFRDTRFGEGLERIGRESDAFFLSLGYRHDRERSGYIAERPNHERVALFAHQGFGLAFLSCVLDIPYCDFCTRFDIQHTGASVIHFEEREGFVVPQLLQLSNDSHLYHEGLSTYYNNIYPI